MIRARLRCHAAWALCSVAKALSQTADRMQPIKLNAPCALVQPRGKPDYRASKQIADDIIEKARG